VNPSRPSPGVRLVPVQTIFDLEMGESAHVRAMQPPPKFDDKGNIQKYTPEELKQLRADHPEFPGFPTETPNLKVGSAVVVYMGKVAEPAKEIDKDREKETKGGSATSPDAPKPEKEKPPNLVPFGALGGVVTSFNETTKQFTLRVDTVAEAGKVPVIDSKALVKDLHVMLVLILKD
jgi:hypothetical protein